MDRHFLGKELARQEVTGLAIVLRLVPIARVQRTRDPRNKMEERQSRDGARWERMGQMVRNLKDHRSELLGQTSVSSLLLLLVGKKMFQNV